MHHLLGVVRVGDGQARGYGEHDDHHSCARAMAGERRAALRDGPNHPCQRYDGGDGAGRGEQVRGPSARDGVPSSSLQPAGGDGTLRNHGRLRHLGPQLLGEGLVHPHGVRGVHEGGGVEACEGNREGHHLQRRQRVRAPHPLHPHRARRPPPAHLQGVGHGANWDGGSGSRRRRVREQHSAAAACRRFGQGLGGRSCSRCCW
mmetsp:Transcript_9673/g.18228  ORF Transcript_9673/g.18228 Transcript_9673/m.18228 type:complete len:203 (+) Transcript_9673:915-1523(+)